MLLVLKGNKSDTMKEGIRPIQRIRYPVERQTVNLHQPVLRLYKFRSHDGPYALKYIYIYIYIYICIYIYISHIYIYIYIYIYIRRRIDFKIAVLTYKLLSTGQPSCLAWKITPCLRTSPGVVGVRNSNCSTY